MHTAPILGVNNIDISPPSGIQKRHRGGRAATLADNIARFPTRLTEGTGGKREGLGMAVAFNAHSIQVAPRAMIRVNSRMAKPS
ncbi:hypothetical protein PAXRUDRAFT_827827 [Paxillus rubicundulus Ve08.2h10]|uniref:Uncharacterized protein n=1 Tax=Paxillus rubicundulus Ve08.2h10 TaxID=930991 RepID=A0A0D0DBM6_9AGAM|nr:hypothetical protein PAXRUDRAFT_827827 [Paxillus rubicundulus Ve08.2h10]